jgi:hypothetical protein
MAKIRVTHVIVAPNCCMCSERERERNRGGLCVYIDIMRLIIKRDIVMSYQGKYKMLHICKSERENLEM